MTRIGVVGDVHACDAALERMLDHLRGLEVDLLCRVGDIVNGPGDPDRCVELLEREHVLTVCGNHDRWLLEGQLMFPDAHRIEDLAPATVAYLRALPPSVELDRAPGVLLCHGLAGNDMDGITADDYGYALEANDDLQGLLRRGRFRLILKGHRHRPAIWSVGGVTLADVGSLTDPAATCAALVDADEHTIMPFALTAAEVVPASAPRTY